ncbi:hypothetical protein BDV28DRAFT_131056 [Aspergillus coremiiformis]|uniref:Uncharacterized protein n=1 Tax=Aspergillus coremiiformis TaxID=138285 RepID=A0A5N6ZAE6_9EURO|nr:hypothetical protein BDV28DRAFT_131056 [Aspergillus coremiiformis]
MSVGRPPLVNLTHSGPSSTQQNTSPDPEQQGPPDDAPHHPVRAKRRKPPLPPSEDPSSKNQIFYFVDSNSSSREKRAHVMRHHVQEKRKQLKHAHPRSDAEKRVHHSLRYLTWRQGKLLLNGDESDAIESQRSARETVPTSSSTTQVGIQVAASPSPSHSLSPVTPLDTSRKDLFDMLLCTREDYVLLDFWANRLTYWSGQNKVIKDQVYQAVSTHPLSFQTVVLAYSARWMAHASNLVWTPKVEEHVGRAEKSLAQVENGTTQIDSDSLAMAWTGMAIQEERFGNKQYARGYVDRAVQILRPSARSNCVAQALLHYVRFMMMPLHSAVPEDGQQWLVTFLRGAESLMLEHNTNAFLSSVPQRHAAFQMDGPLFPLLSSGPHPSQVPADSRIYIITRQAHTQEITRTAALIYITKTLWDFKGSASKTGRFLDYLRTLVREHELDRYPACESFVWMLLLERYDADLQESERSWFTGELLEIHKQLRPDLQFQFSEILFNLLMLNPPLQEIDRFEKELYSPMPGIQDEP